ncbi:winged helix-turn-helix transcriptional regulator [Ectothiorhodospiraceae bacterium WFHF3C12]|nr:winged helix-turn-helix transcriptional regulator [Ectothiorhodospiraceae bacterium WFHF3C12]
MPPMEKELGEDHARQLAEVFHLLGDSNRLRLVLACLEEPVSVNALAERLGLSASLVSHHLRLLKAARLMRAHREGKQVYYQAADEHVRRMLADMVEHLLEPA